MVRQVDFVRPAAKKWREVGVKVVTRINLDVYQQIPLDQIGDTNEKEEILHIVLRIFRRSGKSLMKFVKGAEGATDGFGAFKSPRCR